MHETPVSTDTSHLGQPSRWTARIGLVVVGGIIVSCFGLLIAASKAAPAGF